MLRQAEGRLASGSTVPELARETTRRALDQTRAPSAELKSLQQEELAGSMECAFEALLAESYVPDGVEGDLSFSGDEATIPKPVEMQVYLAMREAVRIALRQSDCSCIGTTLRVSDGEVYGRAEDNGGGLRPRGGSSGQAKNALNQGWTRG